MFGSLRYLGSLFPRHSLQQRLSPLRSSNPAPCFTSLYSQFRTMFSRAVKSYDSTRPAPKATSPPPKPTTQASLMNAFGHKPAPKLTLSRESKVFKQSSVGGNIVPPRHSVVETALTSVDGVPITRKRSFGQRDIATEFNNSSSFQENSPPPVETCAPTGTAAVPTSVYFDEADFEDDNDLDFDITDTAIDATIVKAAASIPSPKLSQPKPQNQAPTFHGQVTSSAPLPWSSSPVEHFQIMPAPQHSNQQETAPVEVEPASKKRRTLPWPTNSEEPIHSINSKVTSKSNPRKTYEDGLPWNTMAADALGAKDTKRAARQQNRALNTTAGDSQQQAKAKKSRSRPAAVFLSDEQKHVITVAEAGKSVFFTGAAGTGKSVLLRELIATLKRKYKKASDSVAVTASTGLAACNIGGVTLHSFAGIGLGKEAVPDLVRKIKQNGKAKSRWLRTKILVIDEISMVDGDLFDKLEAIARQIKNNGRPFGGIQLVITGDFFQLPPVPEGGRMAKFVFDSNTWNTCIAHTIGLTQVFRQRDPEFAGMLNEMRVGKLSPETIRTFHSLGRALVYNDGIEATELFPTRNEVDRANTLRMQQLKGTGMVFKADDTGSQDKKFVDKLLGACMAPVSIELKLHAQVMLIKNIDESLVNGSLGRVIGFMNEKTFDIYTEEGEDLEAALGDDDSDLSTKQQKIRESATSTATDKGRRWPLVQFALPDGTSRQLLVQPENWKVELPNGEVQAQRNQIPLILAWALSIHKAQGQTLERVKVDLGKVFEKGQAYVALSRATCKEGLQVLRFDAKRVMAHDKVRAFYQNLGNATEAARILKEEQELTKKIPKRAPKMPVVAKKSAKSKPVSDGDFEDEEELIRAAVYS